MKQFIVYSLFLASLFMRSQDKVYFLDGTCKTGKITEISSENIILEADETESIPSDKVLLLEFKGGSVEIINKPTHAVVYNSKSAEVLEKKMEGENNELYSNKISINTLALTNADISCFYERILPGKEIGFGVMGAYNFNSYSSFQNLNINILTNAKKNYDLGIFANFYLGDLGEQTKIHFGILFKYMSFNFTKATEEKTTSGGSTSTNIKYSPDNGSQLATLFTGGTYTEFSKKVFFKTLVGIGAFGLHGDYKQQYNYFVDKSNQSSQSGTTTSTPSNRSFLLKLYLGLNLGYNF